MGKKNSKPREGPPRATSSVRRGQLGSGSSSSRSPPGSPSTHPTLSTIPLGTGASPSGNEAPPDPPVAAQKGEMKLTAKPLSGPCFEVTVLDTATVLTLKERMVKEEGYDSEGLVVLFNKKRLGDDSATLESCGVKDGDTFGLLGVRSNPFVYGPALMRLTAKTLSQGTFYVFVPEAATTHDLKKKVMGSGKFKQRQMAGYTPTSPRIVFGSHVLEDAATLKSYGMKDGDTFMVMEGKQERKKPATTSLGPAPVEAPPAGAPVQSDSEPKTRSDQVQPQARTRPLQDKDPQHPLWDMFENEGRPVKRIDCPTVRPDVGVKEAVEQIGRALGLWGKWGEGAEEMWEIADELQQFGAAAKMAQEVGDPDMCRAITCYTYELKGVEREDQIYCRLTNSMRGRKPEEIALWEPFLYYLLGGMQRMPNQEGTLYRGVNQEVKNMEHYDVGSKVTWSTMTSTSKDKEAAHKFLLRGLGDGGHGVFFEIQSTASVEVSAFSEFSDEQELLLPVNCKLIVTGRSEEEVELPEGGRAKVTTLKMTQTKGKKVWG